MAFREKSVGLHNEGRKNGQRGRRSWRSVAHLILGSFCAERRTPDDRPWGVFLIAPVRRPAYHPPTDLTFLTRARHGSPVAQPETASHSYLLLDVAGTPCALPRAAVVEVLPLPDLFRPPACGGWLAGFLNLGGRPVPVIDLACLLGLRDGASEPGPYAHLLLAPDEANAWLVDRVTDLVTVAADAISRVTEAGSLNGCVAAEIRRGDRLIHALDPARILTAEERARIADLTRAAEARLAALALA